MGIAFHGCWQKRWFEIIKSYLKHNKIQLSHHLKINVNVYLIRYHNMVSVIHKCSQFFISSINKCFPPDFIKIKSIVKLTRSAIEFYKDKWSSTYLLYFSQWNLLGIHVLITFRSVVGAVPPTILHD